MLLISFLGFFAIQNESNISTETSNPLPSTLHHSTAAVIAIVTAATISNSFKFGAEFKTITSHFLSIFNNA
jgi:hypothetical protein